MSEPIQYRRETNEDKEGLGQFVKTGGDTTVHFGPTEGVLDLIAAPFCATPASTLESSDDLNREWPGSDFSVTTGSKFFKRALAEIAAHGKPMLAFA